MRDSVLKPSRREAAFRATRRSRAPLLAGAPLHVAIIVFGLLAVIGGSVYFLLSHSSDDGSAQASLLARQCEKSFLAHRDNETFEVCAALKQELRDHLSLRGIKLMSARSRNAMLPPDELATVMLFVSSERTSSVALAETYHEAGKLDVGRPYAADAVVWTAFDAKNLHDLLAFTGPVGARKPMANRVTLQGYLVRDKEIPRELEGMYPGSVAFAAKKLGFTKSGLIRQLSEY